MLLLCLNQTKVLPNNSLNYFDVNCLISIFVITFFLSFFGIDPWESSNEVLEGDLKQLIDLKPKNPNLKVCVRLDDCLIDLISRKLWNKLSFILQVLLSVRRNLETYKKIVSDKNKLQRIIENSRDIIVKHKLDGMNLQLDDRYVFESD